MGKQSLGVLCPADPLDDLITMNAVHGAFYGSAMPSARIEALIAAHVPKLHIKEVSQVYQYRWWDYRRMAPGHSFLLFAQLYYKGFKLSARQFLAHTRRRKIAGIDNTEAIVGKREIQFTAEEIWERDQAHITGMWKAMITCDALGIPYDLYCRMAFDYAKDSFWKRLPKPAQLYNAEVGAHVLIEWDKRQEDRVFFAKHPVFLLENYAGTELQDAYREWLKERLVARSNPLPAVLQAVYTRPQLTEADLKGIVPAGTLRRARLLAV